MKKAKTKKKSLFMEREFMSLVSVMINRELHALQKDTPVHPVPTRQITVPHWGHDIKRGNLSLPNLIEWCEKQTDHRHQAIAAWLVASRDAMDVMTFAAIKQSQIDSRKKERS
jgi:hypothetical protein